MTHVGWFSVRGSQHVRDGADSSLSLIENGVSLVVPDRRRHRGVHQGRTLRHLLYLDTLSSTLDALVAVLIDDREFFDESFILLRALSRSVVFVDQEGQAIEFSFMELVVMRLCRSVSVSESFMALRL